MILRLDERNGDVVRRLPTPPHSTRMHARTHRRARRKRRTPRSTGTPRRSPTTSTPIQPATHASVLPRRAPAGAGRWRTALTARASWAISRCASSRSQSPHWAARPRRAAHAPAAGVESQPAAAAAELEASQCMRAVALTLCKLSEAFGEWAGRSDASSSANAAKCVGEAVGIAEEPPRAPAAAVAEVAVVATVGGAAGERPCAVVTDENAVPPTNIAAAGLGSSLDAVGKAHVADTSPYGGGAAQVVCWAPFCSVVDTLHAVHAM